MQSSFRKVLLGASVLAATCVVAVFGYWRMAGWSLLDSIYMVVITIYGVGYQHAQPMDDPVLRVFTLLVIVFGCTSAIYAIGGFIQMITEGEINRVLEERRMSRGIERMQRHAIVCGYGRVGQMLAEELVAADHAFVIVDSDRERLREAEEQGIAIVAGDATDEEVLTLAGVERAGVLATVLPDDAANVFIALTARELNPTLEIIARGESSSTRKKLLRSGANRVVMPAAIGAVKIARLITHPTAESLLTGTEAEREINDDLEQIGLRMWEVTVASSSPLAGRKVRHLSMNQDESFLLVAVRQTDGTVVRHPPATHEFREGDVLIVLCQSERRPRFSVNGPTDEELAALGARLPDPANLVD